MNIKTVKVNVKHVTHITYRVQLKITINVVTKLKISRFKKFMQRRMELHRIHRVMFLPIVA